MYLAYAFTGVVKKPAFDGQTFETIEDARKHIDSEIGIIYFAHDPEGHDAADCLAFNSQIYAIERKDG